ncbi:MAG TPA: type II toxin-antitoxin system VapC family toxin [Azospirillaceae bacterium]|nr:type II toxin-antitoxin system VapC family toxin [Azospirillaceae bacterium]
MTVDTNILIRVAAKDDPAQTAAAMSLLAKASRIAVPTEVLCEFVWVMSTRYGRGPAEIATSIAVLIGVDKVMTDRAAVDAGLAMLAAGGDFADGVIAHRGRDLGGRSFASFDRRAVRLLKAAGHSVLEP